MDYSWQNVLLSIEVMYKLPIREYFEINFQAGISWFGLFTDNFRSNAPVPGEVDMPQYVGLGLE